MWINTSWYLSGLKVRKRHKGLVQLRSTSVHAWPAAAAAKKKNAYTKNIQFRQIHLSIKTNTFVHLDKYISQF